MKTNNSEIEELKPLPCLLVRRAEYCDQVTTDMTIDYLCQNARDDMLRFVQEERNRAEGDEAEYSKYLSILDYTLLEKLESGEIEEPRTMIGRLDVMYELRRRVCVAYDIPEPETRQGTSLAETIDGPYPPLQKQGIKKIDFERWGLSEQEAEEILQKAYEMRPDLFFVLGEEIRNYYLSLGEAGVELLNLFQVIREDISSMAKGKLLREVQLRLFRMCNVKHWSDFGTKG